MSTADQNRDLNSNYKFKENLKKEFESYNTDCPLGINISTWPYSEETLRDTLRLRIEQEKSKQEYYKLEYRSKCLEILKLSIDSNIPPHNIPILFSSFSTLSDPEKVLDSKSVTNLHETCSYDHEEQQVLRGASPIANFQNYYTYNQMPKPTITIDAVEPNIPELETKYEGGSTIMSRSMGTATSEPIKTHTIANSSLGEISIDSKPSNNNISSSLNVPSNITFESQEKPSPSARTHKKSLSSNSTPSRSKKHIRSFSMQVQILPKTQLNQGMKTPPSPSSMSSSMQLLQFHHWKPNEQKQNRGNNINTDRPRPSSTRRSSTTKRQRTNSTDFAASAGHGEGISNSAGTIPKVVSNSSDNTSNVNRRPLGHSRYRSEASISFLNKKGNGNSNFNSDPNLNTGIESETPFRQMQGHLKFEQSSRLDNCPDPSFMNANNLPSLTLNRQFQPETESCDPKAVTISESNSDTSTCSTTTSLISTNSLQLHSRSQNDYEPLSSTVNCHINQHSNNETSGYSGLGLDTNISMIRKLPPLLPKPI